MTEAQDNILDEITGILEDLLDRAEAGEFSGILAVAIKPDGGFVVARSATMDRSRLLGAMFQAMIDNSELPQIS